MSNYAIELENLSKVYKLYDNPMDRLKESLGLTRKCKHKEYYALDDINFKIEKGECVGIIGTNGSGKSTVLKIITGVLNKTKGTLNVNGRISALLELGAGFNMEYSGIDNVYLNGSMIGFSKEEIDAKLDDILSFADIGDFVYQPVKTYSSGMFVRLAFAVAINIDPEILIVDEALSVGDVFFQVKCYKKFEEFKKMGKTILIVSHDLSSISKYCDRVILLNKGHKLAEGQPKEIVDMYKKLLVNQLDVDDSQSDNSDNSQNDNGSEEVEANKSKNTHGLWKNSLTCNPDIIEYGEKLGEIYDFAILDEKENITNIIEKGSKCKIKMRVRANEDICEPIFAFTIKDIKGTEITGTNTMYEGGEIDVFQKDDTLEISFEQRIDLQGGEYMISFGFTGFKDGGFCVYHRLYDACNLTVVSDKNTVGYYDMNSKLEIISEA